jgi:YrbI family 3-deoxy-D-manno-octulosonate 8-phosphate phosphatase
MHGKTAESLWRHQGHRDIQAYISDQRVTNDVPAPRTSPLPAKKTIMDSRELKALAIIPASGRSKGMPHKNLDLLAGKPLIAHTIERARQTKSISRIVVSTDDPEIAAVSRHYGAEVVWRPAEISGDMAPSESALLHTLDYLEQTEGYKPALMVSLQCTSPLTLPEDMDGAIQALLDENADSVLTVTPFHHFLWRRDEKGDIVGMNHDPCIRHLRKDREPQFLETGAVYVMRAQGFKEVRHRLFGKTAMYAVPADRCLVIDGPVDLEIAEVLMRKQQEQLALQSLPDFIAAVVLDFDGVFTDNKVIVFQDGREAVVCDRGDGWGLAQLKRLGVPIVVLSTEENPVVQARCDKLGLSCMHGVRDKLAALTAWLGANRLNMAQVVYVGNDVNDLACLRAVGCGIAVCDSHPLVRAAAKIVLSAPGGQGAIREMAELIEEKWEAKNNAKND